MHVNYTFLGATFFFSALCARALFLADLPPTADAQMVAVTQEPVRQPKVQIAILLDTSSSMDGLISQAKSELWSVVNRFGEARHQGVAPLVEVALYEYGKSSIPAGEGHLRMISAFTSDLDKVSEDLFALHTNGGDEYAGMVIDRSVTGLTWSNHSDDYRAIFIAGNEPFTQGPVPYATAIANAAGKGIVVNTIHCGALNAGISGKWQHAAQIGEGSFLTIEQNHQVQQIATPFDRELAALSGKLNTTYVGYGSMGAQNIARQQRQDGNAASMGVRSVAARAKTKGGGNYKNAKWDLVDAMEDDESAVAEIATEALPSAMRKMNTKERKVYVKKKAAERKQLQKQIKALSDKRDAFLTKENKKSANRDKTSTFDKAVLKTVNQQMRKKGYIFAK